MLSSKLQPQDLKRELKLLQEQASLLDQNIVKKLDEINRWLKDIKKGSLVSKQFLILFLLQIIKDIKVILSLQSLPSDSDRQLNLAKMTPIDKYWYSDNFVTQLVNLATYNSDHLKSGTYLKFP